MIKGFDEFKVNESTKLPTTNYLKTDELLSYWIADATNVLEKYNKALSDIRNANENGAFVKDEFLKIGDFVECSWSNKVVNFGQIKEFAATFEGKIFPIMYECKENLTPKNKIMSATWLVYKNMVNFKKITNK